MMKRAKLGDTKWNSTILSSGHDEFSDVPILSVQNLCADLDDDQKTVVSKIYLDGDDPAEVVVPKILTPAEISAMISAYIKSLGTLVYWSGDTGEEDGGDQDDGNETPIELTGQWLSVVDALETGNITNGVLNGITFGGKEVKIGNSLETDIAYYQGDDGNLISSSYWIVCGFNGAVPEYVKYKAGDMRYFVKSTDDSDNSERTITVGDAVYTRTWNQSGLKYDYVKVGAIQSVEGEFKYGDTNTDYGTVSICNPYAVPTKLTITLDSGKTVEAGFAGYNMQLWSEHMYIDPDYQCGWCRKETPLLNCQYCSTLDTAKSTLSDSTEDGTTFAIEPSFRWSETYLRDYLNGLSENSLSLKFQDINGLAKYQRYARHNLLQKVSVNPDNMLQAVCPQVNRTYVSGDVIDHTIDTFWIPGLDLVQLSTTYIGGDITPYEAGYIDAISGLCEEPEFSRDRRISYINGNYGYEDYSYCYLRSINSSSFSFLLNDIHSNNKLRYDLTAFDDGLNGFAPACTIG